MTISLRKFLRRFPVYRDLAEAGETITIESRGGSRFLFVRTGGSPRPSQTPASLPAKVTDRWDPESPAIAPDEWEMNR